MPLLNYYSQTKMAKGEKFGYKTAILHLAPYKLSGKNVCPQASKECIAFCLNTSGRGQMNVTQTSRINKTKKFWQDRPQFLKDLDKEIGMLKKRAASQGYKFAVRLNGTSDLAWHRFSSLMDQHPDVIFYDYTKVLNHLDHNLKNYKITFSASESNQHECIKAMDKGANVAVVFQDKLPKRWAIRSGSSMNDRKVIDGDKHDLRFLDPRGVIVGLIAKGSAKKAAAGGFVNG